MTNLSFKHVCLEIDVINVKVDNAIQVVKNNSPIENQGICIPKNC